MSLRTGLEFKFYLTRHSNGFFIGPQSPPRTRKKKNPVFLFFQLKSNSRINVGKLCVRRKALCTSSKYRINMNKVHFD